MARRWGNLIPLIAEPDNLRLAAWKAGKGKRNKPNIRKFYDNLDGELDHLRRGLLEGSTEVGIYHRFTIKDPKERVICAASFRERVLHHAIMNVCHERFDQYLPHQAFASRKNLGTTAAWAYAGRQQKKCKWFLKLDVRKYFDSISHAVLKQQLSRLFKDRGLLSLFDSILHAGAVRPGFGVPIGNLTSQYWANHYLGACDHFVLQTLKPVAYCRYMDDMVLWHQDKERLLQMEFMMKEFCRQELKLELKQPVLQSASKGLPFLGYVFYPTKIRLNQRSRLRFRRKMKNLYRNLALETIGQQEFRRRAMPAIHFVARAHTRLFRSRFLATLEADTG